MEKFLSGYHGVKVHGNFFHSVNLITECMLGGELGKLHSGQDDGGRKLFPVRIEKLSSKYPSRSRLAQIAKFHCPRTQKIQLNT